MSDFSIVIPNWNGQHFLQACFDSIASQTVKKVETILVDNNSSDNSIAYTRKNYPWVKIVALPQNVGFAQGVNEGIKIAEGKFIALLNNDTELDPNWLEEIQKAARRYPEASFFASKMLDFYDRTLLDSCGDAMTWSGRSYKIGEAEKDGAEYRQARFVFGACAGAAVYKPELFEAIGLFDQDFFAYLEDVDIDFRAQLAGYKCLFVPEARVYHIGSATSGKKSAFSFKMMIRNHYFLIYKNYPTYFLWKYAGKLLYAEIRLMAAAFKNNFAKEYWWGMQSAFEQYPHIKRKRQAIQKQKAVSNEYLSSLIEPTFSYKPLWRALHNAE